MVLNTVLQGLIFATFAEVKLGQFTTRGVENTELLGNKGDRQWQLFLMAFGFV
jgi:hypothetical protein